MTSNEARQRIAEDPDFVYLKRFDFSLAKALERYPEGLPDKLCAQALMITEDDWEMVWRNLLDKLRGLMGITL